MHYGQSLVIKSRLLCTVFDSHLREALKKNLKSLEIFQTFRTPPLYSLEISHILGFQKKVHMEGNPPKKLGNKTLGNFYYPRPPLPLYKVGNFLPV